MPSCGRLNDGHQNPGHPHIVEYLITECGYDPAMFICNESLFKYARQQNQLDIVKVLTICSTDISNIIIAMETHHFIMLVSMAVLTLYIYLLTVNVIRSLLRNQSCLQLATSPLKVLSC